MKALFIGLVLAAAQWQTCAAREVTPETSAWPEAKPCATCVTIQFGALEMRLPIALIGKIFISGSEASTLHLLPAGATDGRDSVLFLSATRAAYVGKYHALGLASADSISAEAFFDLLGRPAPPGSGIEKIRKIESVSTAERYVKTSTGRVHAYWIQAAPGNSQYLHFVIDGADTVYTVAGAITPQLYLAILTGLAIRAEP
ncbi:hypothetical protein HSX11_24405 [Oxalobacteraceae bacterium]|nr:hypothetical protein [Oxalobacteraceae bacterium]